MDELTERLSRVKIPKKRFRSRRANNKAWWYGRPRNFNCGICYSLVTTSDRLKCTQFINGKKKSCTGRYHLKCIVEMITKTGRTLCPICNTGKFPGIVLV